MKNKLYQIRFSDLNERNMIWKIIIAAFLDKYFKINDTVLDIGCGFGEFINNIKVKKKFGLDIDETYKTYLKKDVVFIKSPANKIPLENNSIDKIFISNVFEHLERKTIEKTIIELRRVLNKSGRIIVLQPNIRFIRTDYWMFFDHITPIDDRALTEVFKTLGFELIEKIEKFLPFTTNSNFPKHPLVIKLYLKLPILWKFFGKQSLLVYKKVENV